MICRQTQRENAECEWEKEQWKLATVQPNPANVKQDVKPSTPSSMCAASENVTSSTPLSGKDVISIDVSPRASSISSAGANVSPVQPRGCGYPRKTLQCTDYSDFPVNGTADEQEHWFKVKTTHN